MFFIQRFLRMRKYRNRDITETLNLPTEQLYPMKRTPCFLFFLIFTTSVLWGQDESKSGPAWLFMPSAAYQLPGGEMAERFGDNFTAGLGIGYKTVNNWVFSVDGQYLFSDDVKNPGQLFAPVLSENGEIFNQTGIYAQISALERGVYGTFDVSKNLNFWQANPNSGPNISFGAGYFGHWVEIKNPGFDAPQLLDEYARGYDQLSAGPLLKQSIGYLYLSKNHRVNFRISFEVMEAFTTNLRGFSYTTGRTAEGRNTDLLYGFRLQWILPVYSTASQEYFYD